MLKKILIGVLALAAILLLVGFFLPRSVTTVRTAEIAAAPERIYPLVAAPAEWKRWSAWSQRDPDLQIEYAGPPAGAGASWSWKSGSEGNGSMTLTEAEEPRRVAYELRFEGFDEPSTGEIALEPAGAGTRVRWTMHADMGNGPVGRWFGVFLPGMVGKDFDAGLASLKRLAEGAS
ncbi:MAG: SRPBCC family protein [Gemmatimonadales bacterium]